MNEHQTASRLGDRLEGHVIICGFGETGRVAQVERAPLADELGKSMRDIDRGIAVRLYRNREPIGFWERDRCRIEQGDLLLVIEPVEG